MTQVHVSRLGMDVSVSWKPCREEQPGGSLHVSSTIVQEIPLQYACTSPNGIVLEDTVVSRRLSLSVFCVRDLLA